MTLAAAIMADFVLPPFKHQLAEFEFSSDLEDRALLWTMRTGKTKVIIDTACHLYREGKIDAVLIVAPNGVHENWVRRELPKHHWDSIPYESAFWDTQEAGALGGNRLSKAKKENWDEDREEWFKKIRQMLGAKDYLPWFSIASDTMIRKDVRRLAVRVVTRRRALIVFDESHDFRIPGSKRSRMARALSKRCAFRRILTGTLVENSPLHSWSQYELLEPGALGFKKYRDFKNNHAVFVEKTTNGGRTFQILDHYQNLSALRQKIAAFSSVVLREDCEDLPRCVHSIRRFDLTKRQRRIYSQLLESFKANLSEEDLVSVGAKTQKLIKLQQVTSGFLIDEFRVLHHIPGENPRLEALVDEVRLAGGKCIVWAVFREDIRVISQRLRDIGFQVAEYHGGTTPKEKRKIREAFLPESESPLDVLVGHPKSGGQGLELSAARKIIWYSHTFDAIVRSQADERATKVGGANIPVIDLVAPGVDEYILKNVLKKTSVANALSHDGLKKVLQKIEVNHGL